MNENFNLIECLKYDAENFEAVHDQVRQSLIEGLGGDDTATVLNKGLSQGDTFTLVSASLMDVESDNGEPFKVPVFNTSNGCKVGCKWFSCGSTAGEIADFIIANREHVFTVHAKTRVNDRNTFIIS